jgi:hypothetical protein
LWISFTQVAEKDRKTFLAQYAFTRRDEAEKAIAEATQSLNVVALRDLWGRLERLDSLREFADIHKGVEWRPSSDPERYLSTKPKEGFRKGVYTAQYLFAFERPETKYLCFQREYRRPRAPGGFDLPWDEPKVFVNAARVSWAVGNRCVQ